MKRWLPYPMLWALLLAMWLALNQTLAAGDAIVGAVVALVAVWALAALQSPSIHPRRPVVALQLTCLVLVDILASNVAVARIVLGAAGARKAGFVEIPLDLKNPAGLAALACIITATPGTSWAGYDSSSGVLTMHILDLVDEDTWVRTIKNRYERRLIDVFGAE